MDSFNNDTEVNEDAASKVGSYSMGIASLVFAQLFLLGYFVGWFDPTTRDQGLCIGIVLIPLGIHLLCIANRIKNIDKKHSKVSTTIVDEELSTELGSADHREFDHKEYLTTQGWTGQPWPKDW